MSKTISLAVLFLAACLNVDVSASKSDVIVKDLQCEHLTDPLGIDVVKPQLSWRFDDPKLTRGQKQTAYRIIVSDIWDSGKVISGQSINVVYAGPPLSSGQDCWWKVMIWDKDDKGSRWSETARFSIGLLNESDWKGSWLGMRDADSNDTIWFRKKFHIHRIPKTAFVYMASLGFHELYVNGEKIDDRVLPPNRSKLDTRVLYNTYDVTRLLRQGDNVIAVWLALGWARPAAWNLKKAPLFKLESNIQLRTDQSWKCKKANIRYNASWDKDHKDKTYFGGEIIDAGKYLNDWNAENLDDSAWPRAEIYPLDLKLSADMVLQNKKIETFKAIGVNKNIIDMGRDYTGWVQIPLSGAAGSSVTLKISDVNKGGSDYNQNYIYIFDKTGRGIFCNRFNWFEGRYITIEGDAKFNLEAVNGFIISNDMKNLGSFKCSNNLLNNIYNAALDNMQGLIIGGVPVDCQDRERVGWSGDAHTSLEGVLMNWDALAMYKQWINSFYDGAAENGMWSWVSPYFGKNERLISMGWTMFPITASWEIYLTCGDKSFLLSGYEQQKKFMSELDNEDDEQSLLHHCNEQWDFLGDWCTPHGSEWSHTPEAALFNNCCYLFTARNMENIANALGKTADAKMFAAKVEAIKAGINKTWFNRKNKTYVDMRQAHSAVPLYTGAVEEQNIKDVEINLKKEILITHKGHLDTGLHGTYFMTKYLSENGMSDIVYTYTNKTTYPGWGHFVSAGLNTFPESWNPKSDSKMHGCHNSIAPWFQKFVAGINYDPANPGFKHFIIKPAIVGDLTWAEGSYLSVHGNITSKWKKTPDKITLNVTIPVNTTAKVYIPADNPAKVTESGISAEKAKGLKYIAAENGYLIYKVESGKYSFTSKS